METESALHGKGVDFIVEKHVGGQILLLPCLKNIIYNINYFEHLRKSATKESEDKELKILEKIKIIPKVEDSLKSKAKQIFKI